jgi:hypothetical protein
MCDDESGGLATAEILLAGCPVIGIECGAPFVVTGGTGVRVDALKVVPVLDAIRICHSFDRHRIRETALRMFDADRIADAVVATLDYVRGLGPAEIHSTLFPSLGFPIEDLAV